MNRRHYLTTVGTGVSIVAAGCLGGGDDDPDGDGDDNGSPDNGTADNGDDAPGDTDDSDVDDPNGDDDDDADDDPTSLPAEYTISADVPDEAELYEEISISWTITNEGEGIGDGHANYGVEYSTTDGGVSETVILDDIQLAAGESQTQSSGLISFTDRTDVTWEGWIEGPESSDSFSETTSIVDITRAFSETYVTPTDVAVTVGFPDIRTMYEYQTTDGGRETHEAPSGMEFVLVQVTAENTGERIRQSPSRIDFELVADGTAYPPMSDLEYRRIDMYEGLRHIETGEVDSGIVPFEVPTGSEPFEIHYDEQDLDTGVEWEVVWQ